MPLEPEDYREPACLLDMGNCTCGSKESCACRGGIPLEEIIRKCDELFNAEKSEELGEHLRHWRQQAQISGDKKGELSILSELMGHYRMNNDPLRGIEAVHDGMALIRELDLSGTLSAGTILLNGATALQSFGEVEQSLSLYAESARIYERHLDPSDWRFAGLYNNMAAAYSEKKEFKLAEKCYLRALDVLKVCGNIMDSAVTCLNLAQLYRIWNNDPMLIDGMLACAAECFDSPEAVRDGYYAHTCRKCASGFGALGRSDIEQELNSRADQYYEGH